LRITSGLKKSKRLSRSMDAFLEVVKEGSDL
jgi:hypothetical protein